MDRLGKRGGLFITGTDTDVGKTVVTSGLITFLKNCGLDACGVKPVCCGGTEDLEEIQRANVTPLPKKNLNPLYLEKPAAPQSITQDILPLSEVLAPIQLLAHDFIIAEGAGGWKVPVSRSWDMESLAVKLGFPVVLVIGNKLGCLNHTLLTVQAIERSDLPLVGYFLNTTQETEYVHAQETNQQTLKELLPYPCLGNIPLGGASLPSAPLTEVLKMKSREEIPLHLFPPSL